MDGIVPDFALRSDMFPNGNYGADVEFRGSGPEFRLKSANPFRVSAGDAVALAVSILTAYAPEKLAGSAAPIRRVDAPRVRNGEDLAWVRRPLLKGAFVNVVEGEKAPTVAFGDLDAAEAAATRLATKAPGKRVLTLRIETAREAKVITTIEKD